MNGCRGAGDVIRVQICDVRRFDYLAPGSHADSVVGEAVCYCCSRLTKAENDYRFFCGSICARDTESDSTRVEDLPFIGWGLPLASSSVS